MNVDFASLSGILCCTLLSCLTILTITFLSYFDKIMLQRKECATFLTFQLSWRSSIIEWFYRTGKMQLQPTYRIHSYWKDIIWFCYCLNTGTGMHNLDSPTWISGSIKWYDPVFHPNERNDTGSCLYTYWDIFPSTI